ncbi:MAG: type I DNA topoisomerase [Clostridia bacterium]|nr:type I DNA topoisomerase [Clostridia bacterium]
MSKLVIVESPSKAKTIKKYLGSGYEIVASMGHLRDLPKSSFGIDVDNDFEPKYIVVKGKAPLAKELAAKAKKADMVYLASDPDREGEAIAWHLRNILKVPAEKSCRVTFNEITKTAVKAGIKSPRDIDTQLVDAYQARRVLDRIVGYQLSPLLWRRVKMGLSAGRVQSVVTRMVVDRDAEIDAFIPEEYWVIEADLSQNGAQFKAKFNGKGGKKIALHNGEEANDVLSAVRNSEFRVTSVKRAEKKRQPAPPFITASLQQEASRRLGFTARKTMMIAQNLYEGVELGKAGMTGIITYMRTDSLRLSDEIVAAARDHIAETYGKEYLPASPRVFKMRSGAQDAHEAIRPTSLDNDPARLKAFLNADQYKLYKLIWDRFVASQMSAMTLDTVSVVLDSAGYDFHASGYSVKFPGFSVLYAEQNDDEEEANALPPMAEGDIPETVGVNGQQKFTQPPAHYNEASLIRAMEENGIGRPSTYATTVATIIDREYVVREGKSLRATPLGRVVTELMKDKFSQIIDVDFTARMEDDLDRVGAGELAWKQLIGSFYEGFAADLAKAESELGDTRLKVPEVETDVVCEKCGRNMVIKSGRFGKFLACPGYPECKNTKPITVETEGACPLCGGKILEKKSKNGNKYYGCEHNPTCGFMTWDQPLKNTCPKCGKTLFRRYTRAEKKIYCADETCGYSEIPPARRKKGTDDMEKPEE